MSSKLDITRIAKRYAVAGFAWAEENKSLKDLEKDLGIVEQLLSIKEFRAVLETPLMSRLAHMEVVTSVAKKAKLSDVMTRIIGVLAENRRLYVLPAMLTELQNLLSAHKGEITVEVISATELSKADIKKITDLLKKQLGHSVDLKLSVDEELIGGLVVKAGSLMVDSSVKTQLEKMKRALKNSDVMVEQEKMKEVA